MKTWTGGYLEIDKITDTTEFNKEYDSAKGVLNGGLDRDQLPSRCVTKDMQLDNAFHLVLLEDNFDLNSAYQIYTGTSSFKALTGTSYSGGWVPWVSINVNTKEGMLHTEADFWSFLRVYDDPVSAKWAKFRLTYNSLLITASSRVYLPYTVNHLVGDIFVPDGAGVLTLWWKCSPLGTHTFGGVDVDDDPAEPILYLDGGQVLYYNRYR